MDSVPEVIVISDSANENANCYIYDLKTGSVIATYKGHSAKKCLSFIRQDYIITALNNQPILKFWILNKNMPETHQMHLPGLASALAVSNCGMFCGGGIGKELYIWEVPTGALLTSIQHHSQPITCIKFTSDGSHIITGGKDGMVLVWIVSDLVSVSDKSDNPKPRYVWLHHAAEVTDIFVGPLGVFAHVATVSRDMSCRIYELETGNLLNTIHFDCALTAVTMDGSEYFLLLGSADGNIYRVNMFSQEKSEVDLSSEEKYAYVGHSKEITCLSVSLTGKYLLSGSEDCNCRIWDLMSFSCIRKLDFRGPITNAFITLLPPGLKNESQYYPHLKISTFKRNYAGEEEMTAKVENRKLSLMHVGAPDEYFDRHVLNCSEEAVIDLNKSNLSQEMMSRINCQMYAFALAETYDLPDEDSLNEDTD